MPVIVTFLDSSTVWFEIEGEVTSRVPLLGVTWLQNGRIQRLLDRIDVVFAPFSKDIFPRAVPGTPTQLAVHLYLVSCEDPELYKTSVKKQLTDWLSVVGTKKTQEPLIVYLSSPDPNRKQAAPRLFGGSVFDRIKSDFAKTNIIHLKPSHAKDPSIWTEFFAKLRELILVSFNAKLLQYDEDTRRLDAQRLLPGWNYCQFFILKDGAACTYEYLNVVGEALLQYDELEAAFFQNLQEQGAPWFQSFGGSSPGDDSHDFLDLKRKPYRDMILQNTITIFDFRIYLFARQIELLFKSPSLAVGVVEACVRAKKFISLFAMTLHEYSAGLIPFFTESWIYTSCTSLIHHCDTLLSSTSTPTPATYSAVKSELLHYARLQLDILGSASNIYTSSIHHLSAEVNPLTEHSNDGTVDVRLPIETVTNEALKTALGSAEAFDALYLKISRAAVEGFESGGRKRTGLIVLGDVASLHFHRKRFAEASLIWDQITTQFGGKGWESMEEAVLGKLIVCQRELGKKGPLVDSCLRLLGTESVQKLGEEKVSEVVDWMNGASAEVGVGSETEDAPFVDTRIFKVSILGFMNRIANDDAHVLQVQIDNALPKAVQVQEITSLLAGKDSAGIFCKASSVTLNPGPNVIRLLAERVFCPGTYVVEKVILRIANSRLEYEIPKTGIRKRAFKVLEQVKAMELVTKVLPSNLPGSETHKTIQITLSHPVKQIQSASLRVIPLSPSASIPIVSIPSIALQINSTTTQDVLVKDQQVTLPAFGSSDTITFAIPLLVESPSVEVVDVKFVVLFTTQEDGKEHLFTKVESIQVAVAIQLSHTVIPRDQSTLLQLKVVGGHASPLRIDSVDVTGLSGFKVTNFSNLGDGVLFQHQTQSLVYLLDALDPKSPQNHGQKGKVVLKAHSVADEITHHMSQSLTRFLTPLHKTHYSSFLLSQCTRLLNLNTNKYTLCGKIVFPTHVSDEMQRDLRMQMETEEAQVVEEVCGLFVAFVEEKKGVFSEVVKESGGWVVKEGYAEVVEYEFETSDYQIVLAAEIKPLMEEPGTAIVGDILPCKLVISNTCWSSTEDSIDAVYEIKVRDTNWVIAGHKRHQFKFKKGQDAEFLFHLVSIGAGKLLLPSVSVTAVNAPCGVHCTYPSSEEVLVCPLESKLLAVRLED
ncbi:hypothetical protein HDU98_000341 [Podochytrium sp. JEL0797]|nr:hypothetical protein HDU98_000341 [Podochytrium sp. JEL0797]